MPAILTWSSYRQVLLRRKILRARVAIEWGRSAGRPRNLLHINCSEPQN